MGAAAWLLGGVVVQAAPAVAGREGSAPRARVVSSRVDLGVVPIGPDARATFAIENGGGTVLQILAVEEGCLCTVAEFDRTIAPGATGHVRVNLLTASLQGPVTQGLVVRTNDPEQPQIVLTLEAEVVGAVELLPSPVVLLRDRGGAGPVGRVLVRRLPEASGELAVRDVSASVPWLAAGATRLVESRPRGDGLPEGRPGDWVVEVRFRDDRRRFGPQRGQVRFRTGLPAQPEVVFEVESDFKPPVTLSTSRLVLSGSAGAARGTAFATVREGLDPGLLRVESDTPALDVRLERAAARTFKVDVRWAGQTLSGASVRLGIGDEWVELPVEWSISR
jgi:hypothetical protein